MNCLHTRKIENRNNNVISSGHEFVTVMSKHKKLFFRIDYDNVETAYDLLQTAFSPIVIHCTNCMKVRRDFTEAFRGYLIGKGVFNSRGSVMGRSPIISMEKVMEKKGASYEVSFTHEKIDICGTISKECLYVIIYDISNEWLKKFKEKVLSVLTVVEIIELDSDSIKKGKRCFYEDLAKRLEEGDFEGGESRSYSGFDKLYVGQSFNEEDYSEMNLGQTITDRST